MPRDPTRTTMCTASLTLLLPTIRTRPSILSGGAGAVGSCCCGAGRSCAPAQARGDLWGSMRIPERTPQISSSAPFARRCEAMHFRPFCAPEAVSSSQHTSRRPVDGDVPTCKHTRTQARARTGQIGAELLDHVNRSASLTEGPVRRRARAPTFAVFNAACDGSAGTAPAVVV